MVQTNSCRVLRFYSLKTTRTNLSHEMCKSVITQIKGLVNQPKAELQINKKNEKKLHKQNISVPSY